MTVSSATASQSYTGNGTTAAFAVPFYFLADTDLKVTRKSNLTGVVSVLTLNSDYTLTGAGNLAGGTLTTIPALPNLDTLYIERNVSAVQQTEYPVNSVFPAASHERALDRLTMLAQQILSKLAFGLFRDPLTAIYDAGGSIISNASDGSNATDLATVQQVDSKVAGAAGGVLPADIALYSALGNATPGKGSSLVTFMPPDPNGTPQTVSAALGGGVPVTWYASVAQLAVDATAATQAAIAYAYSSGRKQVYFPGGNVYRFAAASASIDPGVGDISFFGDGASSQIIFEEGTGTGDINTQRKSLFRNNSHVAKGSLEFRNLHIRGTWSDKAYAEGGGTVFFLDYYDEIVISGCRFENLSWMASACEFAKNVRVIGNSFDTVCRDMVRFRSSFNVQVIGNRFRHGVDDCVALHSNIGLTGGDLREGIVVADNIFEDAGGIKILAGRMVSVHNNILRRCKIFPIAVYSDAGSAAEANSSLFGISIKDNQIYDSLNGTPFSTAISQAIYVGSRVAEAGTDTGNVIPGENNVSTGAFALPWNSRNSVYSSSTNSVAPPFFIQITGNIIARTLPAVATYSLWGYGQALSASGFTDPAVTDAALRIGNGINLSGQARKVLISGNNISHVSSAIGIVDAPLDNFGIDDCLIANNQFTDFNGDCIRIPNPAAPRTLNLLVSGNTFDGDPYHIHANRGANGTYVADGSPSVIACVSYSGIKLAGNKIRNVCRVVNNGGGTGTVLAGNFLRCAPAAVGFSTSNKGIGNLPEACGQQVIYEHVDSDPTSATYGATATTMQLTAGSIPTAGTYVRGTFVSAVGSTTILGWQRLTTGSAHVSGTDWKTVALT